MSLIEKYKEINGANKFLAEHCQKTLKEQHKLLCGISHAVNRCNAEYADSWQAIEDIRAILSSLPDIEATIGRMQEQVATLEESLDKARTAFSKLKNGDKS